MNTVYVKNFSEPEFNISEILRYALCKQTDDAAIELLNKCICEVRGKLIYKVCYTFIENNHFFDGVNSELLNKYLSDCDGFVLFAATIGIEIDRLMLKYGRLSPAKAHMLQAIGAERTEALCDVFTEEIKKQLPRVLPRISPGYGDFPIELQRKIFDTLDCPRKIGLTLNNSLLMSPIKSVTAIIGVKK